MLLSGRVGSTEGAETFPWALTSRLLSIWVMRDSPFHFCVSQHWKVSGASETRSARFLPWEKEQQGAGAAKLKTKDQVQGRSARSQKARSHTHGQWSWDGQRAERGEAAEEESQAGPCDFWTGPGMRQRTS